MIDAAHDGIMAALREGLPGLRDVLDYGSTDTLNTPAAVLNLAGLEPGDEPEDGSGLLALRCRWEVFLVLAARTPGVERKLRELAGACAAVVQGQRFGLSTAPARFVLAEPNEFEPTWKAARSWRVEFEQVVRVGESAWDAGGVAIEQVLVSHTPLIGTAHETEYEEVTDEL